MVRPQSQGSGQENQMLQSGGLLMVCGLSLSVCDNHLPLTLRVCWYISPHDHIASISKVFTKHNFAVWRVSVYPYNLVLCLSEIVKCMECCHFPDALLSAFRLPPPLSFSCWFSPPKMQCSSTSPRKFLPSVFWQKEEGVGYRRLQSPPVPIKGGRWWEYWGNSALVAPTNGPLVLCPKAGSGERIKISHSFQADSFVLSRFVNHVSSKDCDS